MISLKLILLVLAFVTFVIAALNVPAPKVNLTALGLALWVLSQMIA